MRAGAQTLVLLSSPLNALLLHALADGPRRQTELRRIVGSPAQSTLRASLQRLADTGAIEKRRRNRFPGVLEYELTAGGRDLHPVLEAIERWLREAPGGPLKIESNTARAAVRALADGWSTTMLRALAAAPLSLTELDGIIGSRSYPALERRLAAMRLAGLVEPCPGRGRLTPCAVTDWLRYGLGPILAAARWESRPPPAAGIVAFDRLDIETAFMLAAPLLRLPPRANGTCRLGAEVEDDGESQLAGVTLYVRDGGVASCSTDLRRAADSWVLAPPSGWLDAIVGGDRAGLELGGATELAASVMDEFHEALFGVHAGGS